MQTDDPIPSDSVPVWPHRLAVTTAAATLPLLFLGGLVTSMQVGMVVPDWPTTFGYNMFLYPWSKMVGGIFYEHSHRLLGAGVGMLTLGLAATLWVTESRRWLAWLGVAAVVAVVVQGVLGGLRVVLIEQRIAIVHACLAQAFFALVASISLFTAAEWRTEPRHAPRTDAAKLRRFGLLNVTLIYAQLVLGAVFRHTGAGLGLHIAGAMVVFVTVFLLVDHAQEYARQSDGHAAGARLLRSARTLRGLVLLQIGLGLAAYVVKYLTAAGPLSAAAVLLATGHVIVGALLLVTSLRCTLRAYRLSGRAHPVTESFAAPEVRV